MKLRFLWRAARARFRDQRAEIASLVSALRPGDVAVDVGANKGSYLYWLSRAVGPGRVIAFEPQDTLARYLGDAAKALGLENVVVENQGVSDTTGARTLYVPGATVSPGASFEASPAARATWRPVAVASVALDDYFPASTRIAAIKIDVEGHEAAVLRGARRILATWRPALVVECENRHLTDRRVEDVLREVTALGYDGAFVRRGRLHPLSEFDASIHQRVEAGEFWRSKDYCNNFVLTPQATVGDSSGGRVLRNARQSSRS